jgi:arabinogalactan oligomer/maltooligosaccharide transport system substrate-binding protein
MIKRSLAAVLAASALVVAACGGDDDTADETTATTEAAPETTAAATETTEATTETTAAGGGEASADSLVIWADDLKVPVLQEVAPAFTDATGVDVTIELVPFNDIRDQVTQAGPAGEGPDIFVGAHDWTGELAANGIIDSVDVSAKADEFIPVALQGFNFEGQNYAVPYVTEAVAMFRNTDLVPDAPETWDDLVAACDAIDVENCVVVPGGGTVPDAYHNYPLGVSSHGGYIFAFDETTGFDASQVGLDSPEGIESANWLAQQVADGIVANVDGDTAQSLFIDGKAAFFISGPWQVSPLTDGGVNWDVSVIPTIDGNVAQPFVGAQGFFLSAFSEKALIAQSFLLDFVATQETMQALYDADPRGTAWTSILDSLADDPVVQTFGQSAANGIPMPNIPQMASVWGPLGDNMLLIRNGELDGETAMTNAAEAVRAAVAG